MDIAGLPWFFPLPIAVLCFCLGILFSGFLVITYGFIVERKGLYGAISLLSVLGLGFIGCELGVILCSYAGKAGAGLAFHRAEALSAVFFIFALPFYLAFLLESTPALRKMNRVVVVASAVAVACIVAAAIIEPASFIGAGGGYGEAKPWSQGRGVPGPAYAARDALIAVMGIYSLFMMIVEYRLYRDKRHIILTTLGAGIGILSGIVDVALARIERATGLFSIRTFSFFGPGVTLFVVSCMIGVLRWYIDSTRTIGRAQKIEALSLLAGGIAHDFNNILGGILGHAALLKDSPGAAEREAAREIEKEVSRARSLSAQMITYARGGVQNKKALDVAALLKEIAASSFANSRVAFSLEAERGLWMAWADPVQLSQVFQNVFLNAKQAMRDRGRVSVTAENHEHRAVFSTKNPGRYVILRVRDDGPGIPAENEKKIFDPYFSTKETGTGLGLSVCWAILKSHGGSIELVSGDGKGAEFLITLPAVKAAAAG